MEIYLPVSFLLVYVIFVHCETEADKHQAVQMPPCLGCKTLVSSFKKAIHKTNAGNSSNTETSPAELDDAKGFAVIKGHICEDVEWGHDHCKALAVETMELLEDWWLHKQEMHPDVYEWLCVSTKQVCCPPDHFGPDCQPCLGYPGKICNGNGKCRGAGTRKGNGSCICDTGYEGDFCDRCAEYYYESYRDENKLLCSLCHESCQGTCSRAGPKGCAACQSGWTMDTEKGCLDIDECYTIKDLCTKNQFCVNNDGSYVCLECDRSCNGCNGDGPDMCLECGRGYSEKDGMCMNNSQLGRDWFVILTRYLTYAGLCVATCIVFQKNMVLAGLIGLSVGVYISVAEYYLGSPSDANNVDVAKMLGIKI